MTQNNYDQTFRYRKRKRKIAYQNTFFYLYSLTNISFLVDLSSLEDLYSLEDLTYPMGRSL